ncbi:MAG: hypothetical protein WA364_01835 [Candidatus Nitrosopolaris sp.]
MSTSTGTGTKIFEKGTITFGGGFKETVDNRTIWQGGFDPEPVIPGNSDLLHILEVTGTINLESYV